MLIGTLVHRGHCATLRTRDEGGFALTTAQHGGWVWAEDDSIDSIWRQWVEIVDAWLEEEG